MSVRLCATFTLLLTLLMFGCAAGERPSSSCLDANDEIVVPSAERLPGEFLLLTGSAWLSADRDTIRAIYPVAKRGHAYPLDVQLAYLATNDVNDAMVRELTAVPNLRFVDFSASNSMTDATAKLIARLRHLRRFEIGSTNITDAALEGIGALHSLEALRIRYNANITDAGIAHLSLLTKLKRLVLENLEITGSTLAMLKSKLVELTFSECFHLDPRMLLACGFKDTLSLLRIRKCAFYTHGATPMGLPDFARLSLLDLSETQSEWYPLDEENMSESVCTLSLAYTATSETDLMKLAHWTRLRSVDLSGKQHTTDAVLSVLCRALPLMWLKLDSTAVTGKGIFELVGNPHLRYLSIRDCPAVDAESIRLARRVRPDLAIDY